MSGLPPYQFLPPGHPAWHQALMAQQQAQIAAQVDLSWCSFFWGPCLIRFLSRCRLKPNKQRKLLPTPRQLRPRCTTSSRAKAPLLPWALLASQPRHLS